MAIGTLADSNFGLLAAVSTGAWSPSLPLANLLQGQRYVSNPARQLTPTVLANSKFLATLDRARPLELVGLLFHTLSLRALYRITVVAPGGTLAAPVLQTAWLPVYPRLFPSMSLGWLEPNWWTGQQLQEDILLYPRHVFFPLPQRTVATQVQVEIDDSLGVAGYFDIGGLWLSANFTPGVNFERGRERGRELRDVQDEGPSGRLFTETRPGRRTLSLSYTGLSNSEADRLGDMAARVGAGGPVVVIPDASDYSSMSREAGLYQLTLKGPTLTYNHLNSAAPTLREIIA